MRIEFFALFLAIISGLLSCPVSAQSDHFNSYFERYLANPQMPTPVGIVSYGLYPAGSGYHHYTIETDKIMAKATINSLLAHDNSSSLPPTSGSMCITGQEYQPSITDMQNGANLQFNAMMQVNTTTGSQMIWLQDTTRFNTGQMTINMPHDIVANITSGGNENIAYGNGIVNSPQNGVKYYEYEGTCYKYLLPLTITYEIDVHEISRNLVQTVFKNDGNIFDTVYLPIPNVKSAHIVVAPNRYGIPYDAEFVWAGYCCSQQSTFAQMNSTLAMYYQGDDSKLHKFPSLYTFGADTAETASNLLVKRGGHVVTGKNDNMFLESGENFATLGNATIPSWIKNDARLWSHGQISDTEFVMAVQYLVQNRIMQIPATQHGTGAIHHIPAWIRNDAAWWANGQMSDNEFVMAMQYLVSYNVI